MNFLTLNDFYKVSIIPDLNIFYDNCLLLSIKSSNNQEIIDKMPFWKFIKLQKSLSKYIEAERNQNGNNSNENDEFKNNMAGMQQSTSSMMNQMKSNFKMPNKLK